jgi:hypothetical protein
MLRSAAAMVTEEAEGGDDESKASAVHRRLPRELDGEIVAFGSMVKNPKHSLV